MIKKASLITSFVVVCVFWFIIASQVQGVINIFMIYSKGEMVFIFLISGILAVLWVFGLQRLIKEVKH